MNLVCVCFAMNLHMEMAEIIEQPIRSKHFRIFILWTVLWQALQGDRIFEQRIQNADIVLLYIVHQL